MSGTEMILLPIALFGSPILAGALIYRLMFPTEHLGSSQQAPYGDCQPGHCRCGMHPSAAKQR